MVRTWEDVMLGTASIPKPAYRSQHTEPSIPRLRNVKCGFMTRGWGYPVETDADKAGNVSYNTERIEFSLSGVTVSLCHPKMHLGGQISHILESSFWNVWIYFGWDGQGPHWRLHSREKSHPETLLYISIGSGRRAQFSFAWSRGASAPSTNRKKVGGTSCRFSPELWQ